MERIVLVYTVFITLFITLLMYCSKSLFYIMIIWYEHCDCKKVEILKDYSDIDYETESIPVITIQRRQIRRCVTYTKLS